MNTKLISFVALSLLWTGATPAQPAESYTFAGAQVIPDGNPNGMVDVRTLSSSVGSISEIQVTLNIAGGFNGDYYVYLAHDDGTGGRLSILLNRVGRTASNSFGYADSGFSSVTFAGSALNDIHVYRATQNPAGGALTLGTWLADGRNVDPGLALDTSPRTAGLEVFHGMAGSGSWALFLADMVPVGQGTLTSWELTIIGAVPENDPWLPGLFGLLLVGITLVGSNRSTSGEGTYDAFLSHSSADKDLAIELQHQLEAADLKVWIDCDQIEGGDVLFNKIEEALRNSRSAVVCFGSHGIGAWQQAEVDAALQRVMRGTGRVIPVLLPGSTYEPKDRLVLMNLAWIDFRAGIQPEKLHQLVDAVRGGIPSGPTEPPADATAEPPALAPVFVEDRRFSPVELVRRRSRWLMRGLAVVAVAVLGLYLRQPVSAPPFGDSLTKEKIRLQLEAASEVKLRQDLELARKAEPVSLGLRLNEMAHAAHRRRMEESDALAGDFSRLMGGGAAAVDDFRQLCEILIEHGVDEARGFLQRLRATKLEKAGQKMAAAKRETAAAQGELEFVLAEARLADAQGDLVAAESCYREIERLAPEWLDARYQRLHFLLTRKGEQAELRGGRENRAVAKRIYQSVERESRLTAEQFPADVRWERLLAMSETALADIAQYAGNLEEAKALFLRALERRKRVAADHPADLEALREVSVSFQRLGELFTENGNLSVGEYWFEKLLEVQRSIHPRLKATWKRDYFVATFKAGENALLQGKLKRARGLAEEAKVVAGKIAADDKSKSPTARRDFAQACTLLGQVALATGRWDQARQHFESGLKIQREVAGEDALDTIILRDIELSLFHLGDLALRLSDEPSAVAAHAEALSIAEKLFGLDEAQVYWARDLCIARARRGAGYKRAGALTKARELIQSSLDLVDRLIAKSGDNALWQLDRAIYLEGLASVEVLEGKFSSAEERFATALGLKKGLVAQDGTNADWAAELADTYELIGSAARHRGDKTGAAAAFQKGCQTLEALSNRESTREEPNAVWSYALYQMGAKLVDVLIELGEFSEARIRCQANLAIVERLLAVDPNNPVWQRDLQSIRQQARRLEGR